jgi:hypothetical protein
MVVCLASKFLIQQEPSLVTDVRFEVLRHASVRVTVLWAVRVTVLWAVRVTIVGCEGNRIVDCDV